MRLNTLEHAESGTAMLSYVGLGPGEQDPELTLLNTAAL